jgi:hypothetical protein
MVVHAVIQGRQEERQENLGLRAGPRQKYKTLSEKKAKAKRTGAMAKIVECEA